MGAVQQARAAVEVLTQQRGKVQQARSAVEVLTQQRGKVQLARTSIEALISLEQFKNFEWGPPAGVELAEGYVIHSFSGGDTTTIPPGELGPAPVEYNGDWSVNGGNLLAPGTGEAVIAWNVGRTNYEFEFDIVNIAVDPGPTVRVQNASNYILVQMNSGGTSGIYQRVGGGYGLLSPNYSIPWANGDHVRVVNTPERVTVYRNGTLVMSVNTTQFAAEPRAGFRTNGGACRFDNVNIHQIIAQSAISVPGMYDAGAIGSLTGGLPFNIPLPADRAVGDMCILSIGHRNLTTVPTGFTERASSIGGQSTSNSQTTRVMTGRLTATHVSDGYITVNPGPTGTVYGLVYSVQLVRSNHSGYQIEFAAAAAGPTTGSGRLKTTPAFALGGTERYVFHQMSMFQNSGVGASVITYPYSSDKDEAQIDRQIGAICRAPYDPALTTAPAATWDNPTISNGGIGTTAVAVYLAPV